MIDKSIIEMVNVLDDSSLEESERLLRSFWRTIEPYKKRDWKNPNRISWEIFAERDAETGEGRIGFYVVCPRRIERMIKSRIKDSYPNAEVNTVENDYVDKFINPYTAEMELHRHHMFATNMNVKDNPLSSILNSMSRLEDDERMMLQISLLPINDTWAGKAYAKYREMLFSGVRPKKRNKFTFKRGILYSVDGLFKVVEFGISLFMNLGMAQEMKNTPIERAELKMTQKKIALPAFNTNIRLAVESKDRNIMSTRLTEMANSFIELDGDNEWRRIITKSDRTMKFIRERKVEKRTNNIVTTSELSPVVRLANKNINVPELKRALKTHPIPQGLDEGLFFGHGLYNSQEIPTYMNPKYVEDFVHPFMLTGGMGGGKTTMIINMMLARALAGYSVILLDTQGDMTVDFLSQIPPEHHDRVVWLNFGDLRNPVALDLMEFVSLGKDGNMDVVDEMFVKDIAKNELISIFKKMWGQNFGPQTEYITRNNITATIETGGTIMEMFRMLVDDEFRTEVYMQIRNRAPFAYSFWHTFQTNFNYGQKMRMVMPSINKIGSFVESPMIRNIMCQGTQNYNFREMMDTGKIVVVTIPKGILIGAWQLIASFIVSKIWLAALSRVNQPIHQRKPCFLASDEADDIINDNFPIMLSQSRKFRLGIVLGFQYLDQIKANNKHVFNALIGNKPNVVALKIGEKDLDIYRDMFKDYYEEDELRAFPNLHGVAQLSINGKPTTPFTIRIPFNFYTRDNTPRDDIAGDLDVLLDKNRKLYSKPIHEVQELVDQRYEEVLQNMSIGDEEDYDHDVEAGEDLISQLM